MIEVSDAAKIKCSEFVMQILNSMFGVMRTRQITLALMFSFEKEIPDKKYAYKVIDYMQEKDIAYISQNGWIVTKDLYPFLYDDLEFKNLRSTKADFRIPDLPQEAYDSLSYRHKQMIECFWIMADYLPSAIKFLPAKYPITMSFVATDGADGLTKIFDLVRIPEDDEEFICYHLRNLPEDTDEIKAKTIRFAIADRVEVKNILPRIGFKQIVKLEPTSADRYSVLYNIEKKEEDIWSYYKKENQ